MAFRFLKSMFLVCAVLALTAISSSAMPIGSVTVTADPATLINAIVDVTNITLMPGSFNYVGHVSGLQSGTFINGGTDVGFATGIILSTGRADNVQFNILNDQNYGSTNLDLLKAPEIRGQALPRSDLWSTGWGGPVSGVDDLKILARRDINTPLDSIEVFDPNVLEFGFTLGVGAWNLNFDYVFASEEYVNFINSPFNDAFGFFIDGQNVAVLSDGTIVSVNSIFPTDPNNDTPAVIAAAHSQFYRNNVPGYFTQAQYLADEDPNTGAHPNPTIPSLNLTIEPDGLSTVLAAQALTLGPGQHSVRLIIGDLASNEVDSAVFVRGGSFSATPVIPEPGTLILIGTGLAAMAFVRRRIR